MNDKLIELLQNCKASVLFEYEQCFEDATKVAELEEILDSIDVEIGVLSKVDKSKPFTLPTPKCDFDHLTYLHKTLKL